MNNHLLITPTPWDSVAFGMPTWEVPVYSAESLIHAESIVGHQTIRVDPLANKKLLHEHGFYYCDTLITPTCKANRLRPVFHPDATILKLVEDCCDVESFHGIFAHGRFHRDFNLPVTAADVRYTNWLKQLVANQQVYGLYWKGVLAGFIGYNGSALLLHAVSEEFRGQGLAKYWWSDVCQELIQQGQIEITSSISAANVAVLNLYASLGFSFTKPQDIYHRVVA